ncbi:MAG TPA: hypothetical protein VGK82_12025 [Pyrinomonadaceae bacterium]
MHSPGSEFSPFNSGTDLSQHLLSSLRELTVLLFALFTRLSLFSCFERQGQGHWDGHDRCLVLPL